MSNQTNSTPKPYLTLREAADYANCSTTTLRRAVVAKALPHHRFGLSERRGKIFIKATDLQQYINSCRSGN
ncbi:MAG: helix-turn-helix domain-containing protein [Chthoniobacteraceae bacterium]